MSTAFSEKLTRHGQGATKTVRRLIVEINLSQVKALDFESYWAGPTILHQDGKDP
jgi:hypothetical protein